MSELDIEEPIKFLNIQLHFSNHQTTPVITNGSPKRLCVPRRTCRSPEVFRAQEAHHQPQQQPSQGCGTSVEPASHLQPYNAHLTSEQLRKIHQEPNAWMARIPDDRPVNHLSIPGTHDSCARSQVIYVQTQTQTVAEQLLAGVRALDLRLRRHRNGQLFCYHGGVPLGSFGRQLALSTVMADVWTFMIRTGFTETVLVSIDNDDSADRGSAEGRHAFYEAVDDFIRQTPRWGKGEGGRAGVGGGEGSSRWYLASQTPTLGQVRGKVILLRRFPAEKGHSTSPLAVQGDSSSEDIDTTEGIGFDLSAWVNNSPDFIIQTPHAEFRIQDRWKYSERIHLADLVESKSDFVKNLMDQAIRQERERGLLVATQPHDSWFIHFTSAVGEPFKHGEIATARSIAVGDFVGWGKWQPGVNIAIAQFIKQYAPPGQRQRLGVVFMDFAVLPKDAGLLDSIIATNFDSIEEAALVLGERA
ncbi:uncharacterized protein PgNI_01820 [Pyricularia grisea]|uniref:Phosphatidylinositol-specific phospholipase C X domain-containing protein n=1 Tax=Pyricularia grisea TaxID=148305 RepID=A0A6P8BLZ5_PYRGI|nr:uncharacterized protein PgNI_01820 [Pyricularia grisea]TLD17901.1 hypothetical protein PgNI_01820 [Pyricularia grisea]